MKKTILALMIIFGVFLTLPLISQGAYQVSVDDTFTYTIAEAEADFNMDDTDFSRDFLSYEDVLYSEGEEMEVKVTNVASNSIGYTITIDGNIGSREFLTSTIASRFTSHYIMITDAANDLAFNTVISYVYLYGQFLTNVLVTPFLPTDQSTWNILDEVPENYQEATSSALDPSIFEFSMYENKTEDTANISYEWGIKGERKETGENEYNYENQVRFVYSKSTGVMQGLRLKGGLVGFVDSLYISINMSYVFELQGYTMPDFVITEYSILTVGLEWLILPVVIHFGFIIVLRNRRKNGR
jgi:hypothetical protein